MKILIIGTTGFAGTHLYNLLSQKENISLFGTFRHSTKNRNIADSFKKAVLLECDVNETYSIEKVLNEISPDMIFYFASYVSVHSSFKNPLLTFQTNIMGTANFLEAVRKIVPTAKVLIPGSAEVYGKISQENMPIKENYLLNPVNPYGFSKKVQEEMGHYFYKNYGLNIYFTRTFHCTGPGQPLGFVCSDFAKQVVDVENGKIKSIKVGNIKAKRDLTDIRDVVKAYWEIINKDQKGKIYNVCSGHSIPIEEILNRLIILSKKDIPVEVDINKLRASDVPDFVGDNTELKGIGWIPHYSIDDSLKELLAGWRYEIGRK